MKSMRNTKRFWIYGGAVAAAVLLLSVSPALAQKAAGKTESGVSDQAEPGGKRRVAPPPQGNAAKTLEEIEVLAKDGSAEVGYVVEEAKNLGPWGDRKILDTPYTVHVATENYIENIQARSPGELLNRLPGVNFNGGGSEHNFQHTVNVRGFATAGSGSVRFNGVPTGNNSVATFMEEMGSVEVISGLSGFLYGSGNAGGSINYNFKRPVYEYMNKLKVGTYGNRLFFGHADLGGPIGGGTLAYRVNVLAQKGEAPVKDQHLERELFSAALDWNVTEDLLLQFNASYGEIKLRGRQGGFYVEDDNLHAFHPTVTVGQENSTYMTRLTSIRDTPDPAQLYMPTDTFNNYNTTNAGLGLKYKINDRFNLRAAAAYNDFEREMLWGNMFFTTDPDIYKYDVRAAKMFYKTKGAYAYLDAAFETGPLEHKLTVGASGYGLDVFSQSLTLGPGGGNLFYFTGRFSDPSLALNTNLNQYDLVRRIGPRQHKNSDALNYNLIIGDDIKFGERWELLAGLNYSTIRNRNYNAATGALTRKYEESALTPSFALLFKPVPAVTAYLSYIESLEAGSSVPDQPQWSNRNENLPPLRSEQYEAGVKAEVGGMFLTAALYQLDKGLQFGDRARGMYVQDGRQRHRGLELTGRGKITDGLTLMGGLNFLDAEILKTGTAAYVGKTPSYVPKFAGKVYAEYELPFLDGLALTGGLNYLGKVYTNSANNLQIPAFATGDLGLRLTIDGGELGPKMIYRLNVNNVTNQAYWYGGGNSHLQAGQPRSVALSAEIQF